MPEVVYPSNDVEGNPRAWNTMFDELPDTHDAWKIINETLEAIAMNNRFGDKTPDELRAHLLTMTQQEVAEKIAKKGQIDEAKELMYYYGLWVYYTNYVFDNLGGAYRQFKN